MPALNRIELIGRLTRADRENEASKEGAVLRHTSTGRPVIGFRLAADRGGSQDQADFFDVVWWGPADQSKWANFEKHVGYLQKGRLLYVEGRMQQRSYDTQDGSKRYIWEVHATRVVYLDRLREDQAPPPDDEEVPF